MSFTVPLGDLGEVGVLDRRPEMIRILEAAKRHPRFRVHVAAYAAEADARRLGRSAKDISDELVVRIGGYLAGRGLEPERISGRGMGSDPDMGRAAVVSLLATEQ